MFRKGKILCILGLEELILLKCPYYSRQSTDLMQSLWNTHGILHRTRIKKKPTKICTEAQKTMNCQINLEKKEQS